MSPRVKLPGKCAHGEYVQHYSGRGFLSGVYICHHPDKDGCWCTFTPFVGGECDIEKEAEAEPVSKDE